jgi:hypothetical protein
VITITGDMLGELAASVLADSAFLTLEPAPRHVIWPQEVLIAEVPFWGATAGRLVLAASEALMVAATADMLRLERNDALAREAAPATLAELSNVLLGVLVGRFFDPEPPCEVGLPETRRGVWPRTDAGVRCSSVLVDLDERPLAVALTTPAVRLT